MLAYDGKMRYTDEITKAFSGNTTKKHKKLKNEKK